MRIKIMSNAKFQNMITMNMLQTKDGWFDIYYMLNEEDELENSFCSDMRQYLGKSLEVNEDRSCYRAVGGTIPKWAVESVACEN